MWATAVYDFGITSAEFWELNLKEFNALCKRKNLEEQQQEYHAALVCSVIANVNRKRGGKTYRPRDFMASIPEKKTTDWVSMKNALKTLARGKK